MGCIPNLLIINCNSLSLLHWCQLCSWSQIANVYWIVRSWVSCYYFQESFPDPPVLVWCSCYKPPSYFNYVFNFLYSLYIWESKSHSYFIIACFEKHLSSSGYFWMNECNPLPGFNKLKNTLTLLHLCSSVL